MGDRAGVVERHPGGALDELVTEAALSRTRLRGDQDDPRPTGPRVVQRALEPGELAFTADEAREALGAGALEAAPDRSRAPEVEHPYGAACALETMLAAIEEAEEPRRQPRGVLGQADAARGGQLLNARGEPDDVTLRGVVHAQVVADSPDDHLARVEAHAHGQLLATLAPHVLGEPPEVARQIEGGRAGPLRRGPRGRWGRRRAP